jgi:hypothetical protein
MLFAALIQLVAREAARLCMSVRRLLVGRPRGHLARVVERGAGGGTAGHCEADASAAVRLAYRGAAAPLVRLSALSRQPLAVS